MEKIHKLGLTERKRPLETPFRKAIYYKKKWNIICPSQFVILAHNNMQSSGTTGSNME